MWLLRCILLCVSLSLALSGQHKPEAPGYSSVLHCGPWSFQFAVNLSQEATSPPVLIAWGKLRQENGVNPGGGACSEPRSRHCTSAWVTERDSVSKKKKKKKKKKKSPRDAPDTDWCDSIPAQDRLPCAPSPISPGDCEGLGCCYSSEEVNSCYYGNTGVCSEGKHQVIAGCHVAMHPRTLDSNVTDLSTASTITGDRAVYENELVATRDVKNGSRGSVTRDSIFRLHVSCSYSVSSNSLPISVQVFTLPPPFPETQHGPLTLELQIAKDKNYGSYYGVGDYPVVKLLRDPIYVEVSILHRTDPYLGLLLHQCWATPSTDPLSQPQWPILVKGCPYVGDNYQTQLIPVQKALDLPFPSHHQRFSIFTFSFVDPTVEKQALRGPVHLHCSVSVCQPAETPSCVVTCPDLSRRNFANSSQNTTASVSSKGPMILLQATKDPPEKLRAPVDLKVLWVAGLSGTLILGALLVSYLAVKKQKSCPDQMCQ
uniref:Zona pellucida sperm-binding protein 4 n=1 Tax=Nomascus leucogenys TaxID=61853 RepID=A0A2I3GJD4_NOMLE